MEAVKNGCYDLRDDDDEAVDMASKRFVWGPRHRLIRTAKGVAESSSSAPSVSLLQVGTEE